MTQPAWQPMWAPPAPQRPELERCNHVLHLLLTLITCGLWIPIWILVAVSASIENTTRQRAWQQQRAAYDQWMWANYGPPPAG